MRRVAPAMPPNHREFAPQSNQKRGELRRSGVLRGPAEEINGAFTVVEVSVSVRNPDYGPALILAAWQPSCGPKSRGNKGT
jgi:hypothetical protein